MGGCGPEGLRGHVAEAGLLHRDVARGATIDHAEFRNPGLMDSALKAALERKGVVAAANQPEIASLIAIPFAEMIPVGNDGRATAVAAAPRCRRREHCRQTELSGLRPAVGEWSSHALQGQTHAHPGPRKNVPIAVSKVAVTRNHVMIQNESGCEESQRWARPACCDSRAA